MDISERHFLKMAFVLSVLSGAPFTLRKGPSPLVKLAEMATYESS